MTAQKRVRRGAALLDSRKPGWRDQIDLETLCINSFSKCVLGQVFGGFTQGCVALSITTLGANEYGFDIYVNESYAHLQEEWKSVIHPSAVGKLVPA